MAITVVGACVYPRHDEKQDEKLFFSILKSQGMLTESNGSECYGCGFIPTSNGKCSC